MEKKRKKEKQEKRQKTVVNTLQEVAKPLVAKSRVLPKSRGRFQTGGKKLQQLQQKVTLVFIFNI